MRLIDIKNIEDTYKSIKSYLREYTPSRNTDAMIGGMKRLMAEINNIEPTITCRKTYDNWIPVSERLPQASKHILFSVKGKSYTSYGFHNDGIWTDINGAWYTDKEVNAWMPLPSPYKESDN